MDRYADLHSHTTASDGTSAPSRNVELAREAGLAALAVTDHDTVAGVAEAQARGAKLGVEIVPGVEISTVSDGRDIHVLGYYIDICDQAFLARLEELRGVRDRRNDLMLEKLRALGLGITLEEVRAAAAKRSPGEESIGRPHIADVLVRKGHAADVQDAFARYLGRDGAAYVNLPRIPPQTAIAWIREAGGAPVLAHPGLYGDDALVERLAQEGLAGIEAYHSDHSPEDESKYAALAAAYGLAVTAGSDYHGERQGAGYHGAIGSRRIGVEALDELRLRRGSRAR